MTVDWPTTALVMIYKRSCIKRRADCAPFMALFTCDQGRVTLVSNFVPISSNADCFCWPLWLTSIVTSDVDRPITTRCRSATWLHSRKIYTNKRKRCAMVQKKTLIVLWCDKNPIFFLMLIKAELKSSTELFSLHTTSFDHSWTNTENKFILKVAAATETLPEKRSRIPNQNGIDSDVSPRMNYNVTWIALRCDEIRARLLIVYWTRSWTVRYLWDDF